MSKIDIQKLKERVESLDRAYNNFRKNVLGQSENKFFNSDKVVKYLGIKKKARRSNKELHDLAANYLFKLSSKKLELQYKIIIETQASLSLHAGKTEKTDRKEKRQVIDYSNYLDDIEEEYERIREAELKERRKAGVALKNILNRFLITINRLPFKELKKYLYNLVGDNSYFVEINVNGEIANQRNKIISKKNVRYITRELKKLIHAYKQSEYELLQVKLTRSDDINKDLNFPALFAGEINCIIKILKVLYPKKEHQEFLDKYESLIHDDGCKYENLKEITKKLKCNFMIYSRRYSD